MSEPQTNTNEEPIASEKRAPKSKIIRRNRTKMQKRSVLTVLCLMAVFFIVIGVYMFNYIKNVNSPKRLTEANVGHEARTDKISLTIDTVAEITSMAHCELDTENYYYFVIGYSVKNVTGEAITWKDIPYVSVNLISELYNKKNTKLLGHIVEPGSSEAEYDFNALRYYALEKELSFFDSTADLKAGETRKDADVVKIAKKDFDNKTYAVTADIADFYIKLPQPAKQTIQ